MNKGAVHPIPNYWRAGTDEIASHCKACRTGVDGLEFAAHLFDSDPKRKAFIFYHFSKGGGSTTISVSGVSRTVPDGTPLVKMLRWPSDPYELYGL